MRQRCCHDHQLNSVCHLACHLVHRLVLHLVHPRLQNRRDDLRLDEVRQNRRGDLRLDDLVHLGVVRQNRQDDLRLDDLVHLGERQLDEALHLHRHSDEVRHYQM